MEKLDSLDYEVIQTQRNDELTALLDSHNMRTLKQRMEEMNEFDVAEFLSSIQDIVCRWSSACFQRKLLPMFLQILILRIRNVLLIP